MKLIIPDWANLPEHVGALMTCRDGGVSVGHYGNAEGVNGLNLAYHVEDNAEHVKHNRSLLHRILPSEPAWLTQVHGDVVLDAEAVHDAPDADATVTDQKGVVCAIMTADCLPVLFSDTEGKVVGAAHAGWRGLVNGVLEATLQHMQKKGAKSITAWLGAAIGPQAFEVGQDVVDVFCGKDYAFLQAFKAISGRNGKYWADIYLLARIVLHKNGVQHIYGGEDCTFTQQEQFYSYRRDRITGRMASCIWIK